MENINIFDLNKDMLNDNKLYIDCFINIADEKILATIKEDFDYGNIYSERLVKLNPSFKSDGSVDYLLPKFFS